MICSSYAVGYVCIYTYILVGQKKYKKNWGNSECRVTFLVELGQQWMPRDISGTRALRSSALL
jgi:hypothetical protein